MHKKVCSWFRELGQNSLVMGRKAGCAQCQATQLLELILGTQDKSFLPNAVFCVLTFGSMQTPAFPPPNGTSTQAHLYVMRADSALTSSELTSVEYLMPPLHGVLWCEC